MNALEEILTVLPLVESDPFARPRESWAARRRRLHRARNAKRPWFQFSLAGMFRLVAALSVLSWASLSVLPRWIRYQRDEVELYQALGEMCKMGGRYSAHGRNVDLSTDGVARWGKLLPARPHLPVTDTGLSCLRRVRCLVSLDLSGQAISDAGLIHLDKLPYLRRLILIGTNVSDAGVGRVQQALPNCTIVR